MPSSRQVPNWILLGLYIFSIIGFIDATYLTAEHMIGVIPPCSITKGCEQVLTSNYATLFNIPIALFGALFYLASFLLAVAYRETRNKKLLNLILFFSIGAFLASLGFVYIQLFVLHAICQYCMISAGTSTAIFVLALGAFLTQRRQQ